MADIIDTNSMEFQKAVAAEVAKQLSLEMEKIKGAKDIGFKTTMNIDDIRNYHKMLEDKVSEDKIVQFLMVTKDTLKKFSPEIVKSVRAEKQRRLNQLMAQHKVEPLYKEGPEDSKPTANVTDKQQAKLDKNKRAA